jgi:hypothetical protein
MRFVHIFSPAIRVLSGLGLVLLIPVLTGCSPAIGKVSGKVTYKGQPVPGGLITFRPADPVKNSITVELDTEGRYSATLPAGDVTVIIDNRELEPRPSMPSMPAGIPLSAEAQAKLRGKAPPATATADGGPKTGEDVRRPSGRYVPIPEKYYELETSGLKFTIKGGDQPLDIQLTD